MGAKTRTDMTQNGKRRKRGGKQLKERAKTMLNQDKAYERRVGRLRGLQRERRIAERKQNAGDGKGENRHAKTQDWTGRLRLGEKKDSAFTSKENGDDEICSRQCPEKSSTTPRLK